MNWITYRNTFKDYLKEIKVRGILVIGVIVSVVDAECSGDLI